MMSVNGTVDDGNITTSRVMMQDGDRAARQRTFILIAITLGFLIVVSNSAVVYIYRKMDSLKTFSNFLLANLALSDLSTGLVTIPLVVIASLIPFQRSLIPFYFVSHALNSSAIYVIVLNMTLVVLERYLNLCYPYLYDTLRIHSFKRLICAFPWFFVLVLSAVPATWHYKVIAGMGEEDNETQKADLVYSCLTTFICFMLPTLLIGFSIGSMCYNIFNVLRRDQCISFRRKLQRGMKMVIMFMLMFVTMMICWLPWAIIRILIDSGMNWNLPAELKDILFFMRCLSSLLSPLIYAVIKRDFRRAFYRFIQIRRANRREIKFHTIFKKRNANRRNTDERPNLTLRPVRRSNDVPGSSNATQRYSQSSKLSTIDGSSCCV